jgi:hypothetical protein
MICATTRPASLQDVMDRCAQLNLQLQAGPSGEMWRPFELEATANGSFLAVSRSTVERDGFFNLRILAQTHFCVALWSGAPTSPPMCAYSVVGGMKYAVEKVRADVRRLMAKEGKKDERSS